MYYIFVIMFIGVVEIGNYFGESFNMLLIIVEDKKNIIKYNC